MELRDCYAEFGGDYKEVLSRLQREQTVQKFVLKFLVRQKLQLSGNGPAKPELRRSTALVHTLKGICRNLSFTRLYESSANDRSI
ncbi:MAG: hypothetical protein V8T36_03765 [Ruthenibacterium lactatiformans]